MNTFEQVYQIVKQIPKGYVTTYGSIALAMGRPKQARIIGWALHANPNPAEIPCHRVVNASGKLASSFAFGGKYEQYRRLAAEGVKFVDSSTVRPNCIINIANR